MTRLPVRLRVTAGAASAPRLEPVQTTNDWVLVKEFDFSYHKRDL